MVRIANLGPSLHALLGYLMHPLQIDHSPGGFYWSSFYLWLIKMIKFGICNYNIYANIYTRSDRGIFSPKYCPYSIHTIRWPTQTNRQLVYLPSQHTWFSIIMPTQQLTSNFGAHEHQLDKVLKCVCTRLNINFRKNNIPGSDFSCRLLEIHRRAFEIVLLLVLIIYGGTYQMLG